MESGRQFVAEVVAPASDDGDARWLARWEIVSLITTVLIIEWVLLPLAGRSSPLLIVPLALVAWLIFSSIRARGETWQTLGLRFDNFHKAARLLALPMAAVAVILIVAGWWLRVAGYGEPRAGRALFGVFLWSVAWGFLQQFVLQAFVNRRAQIVFGGRGAASIVFVACVFALLHAPNLWLMVTTFAGGLLWSHVYQRAPNLFALALSHAVLSWLLVWTIPAGLLKGMRAGYNYFI